MPIPGRDKRHLYEMLSLERFRPAPIVSKEPRSS